MFSNKKISNLENQLNSMQQEISKLKLIIEKLDNCMCNKLFLESIAENVDGALLIAYMLQYQLSYGTVVIPEEWHYETKSYTDYVSVCCRTEEVTRSYEEKVVDSPRQERFERSKEIRIILEAIKNQPDSFIKIIDRILSNTTNWNIPLLKQAC